MIAVKNIEHDWKRSLSTVIVLSLVGLLIFQQFGSVLGRWNSLGALERELRVDLVVKVKNPPGKVLRPIVHSLPVGVENVLLVHPDIEEMQTYLGVSDSIRIDDTPRAQQTTFISFYPDEDPIYYPTSFPDHLLELLHVEGQAIANTAFAEQYGLGLGEKVSYQGYELTLVAFADTLSNAGSILITSTLTAQAMGRASGLAGAMAGTGGVILPSQARRALLIRLRDGSDPERVAGELRGMLANSNVEVVFPEQLVAEQSFALLLDDRDNRGFLITAAFAILISILIAIQTMRGAVLSHAEEYGALQALGVGALDLRLIAIETAFWLGLLSTSVAISGAFAMQAILQSMHTQFSLSLELVFVVSALLMAISFLAGLFASSAVTKIRPEALLR